MQIVGATGLGGLWALECTYQLIGVDETKTFLFKFFILHENCGRHRLGRFVSVRVGVA